MKRDGCNVLGVRPIDADLIWSSWVFAQIFDVAENMAATVLTDKVAEVCTQTHICHLLGVRLCYVVPYS